MRADAVMSEGWKVGAERSFEIEDGRNCVCAEPSLDVR